MNTKLNTEDKLEQIEDKLEEIIDLIQSMDSRLSTLEEPINNKKESVFLLLWKLLKYLDEKGVDLPLEEDGKTTPYKKAWEVIAMATLYITPGADIPDINTEEQRIAVKERMKVKEHSIEEFYKQYLKS